jgi:CBS domain containing-hemolysin-like protein
VNEIDFVVSSIIAGLVILDLITFSARTSIQSVSRSRLISLHEQEGVDISGVLSALHSSARTLSSLHLFQTLTRLGIGGLLIYLFPWGQGWVSSLTTVAAILVGGVVVGWLEWIVSRRAFHESEKYAYRWIVLIRVLTVIMTPLAVVSLVFSQESNGPQELTSDLEEEVKTLVEAGQMEGYLELEERKMIYSIFQLGDTLAREIMVPRIDMLALEVNTPMAEAIDALLESGFSRVPVFDDTIDDILGLLYAKDLLKVWREGSNNGGTIQDLLRPAYFVPEAKKVDELLVELQNMRVHMALVVDEYGGIAGIVTLEDIIEEIFGEIQDEYDEEELPYTELKNGDYIFLGRIDLDDFNDIMKTHLPNDEADTIGGFIYRQLGHVPVAGEEVKENGLILTVEQVSSRRIRKVRAHRIPRENEIDANGR